MRVMTLSFAVLALAACSGAPDRQESADEFANRIGGQGEVTTSSQSTTSGQSNTTNPVPPAGADVTRLEQLGDISGVNFGPRDGGCTFMEGNRQMIVATGLREPTLPGKGVIRIGGSLILLDSDPGGLDAIRQGINFTGENITVQVAPAAGSARSRPANVTVTSDDGKSASYSGKWICA